MKILIIAETLSVGGAETFAIRMANSLAAEHQVLFINLHPRYSHPDMIAKISPRVTYTAPTYRFRAILDKVDSALLKLRIDYSTLEETICTFLRQKIKEFKPDAIHSHLFKPDYYVARVQDKQHRINHVITNHGDYLLYDRVRPARILNYPAKLQLTLNNVGHFVNISDEQMAFSKSLRTEGALQLHKILNGYEASGATGITREKLGIRPDDFVFGMVARGIPEKGWNGLADAFLKLDRPGCKLLLVGEGPALDTLKERVGSQKNILFAGFSANPVDYIKLFDVGMLPSYYKAESLPTVIIEYLFCGKPVIATEVGEISKMIAGPDGRNAGVLIPLSDGKPDQDRLVAAMNGMLAPEAYTALAASAPYAFAQFAMGHCIEEYVKLYNTKIR